MSLISKRKTPRWLALLTKPIPPMLIRVTAAILLGAATTVGVSWWMALYVKPHWSRGFKMDVAQQIVPTPPFHPQQNGFHLVSVVRNWRWGTDIVEVWPTWTVDPNRITPPGTVNALVEGTSFEAEMKEKFDNHEAPCAMWRADGWPLLALSWEARWQSYDALGMGPVIGGIRVGPRDVFPHTGVRILPLQPIWSGLIINTVFYISLWFALFSLMDIRKGIRSTLRRRRGQCVHCAYKLMPEQTKCSECGEERQSNS